MKRPASSDMLTIWWVTSMSTLGGPDSSRARLCVAAGVRSLLPRTDELKTGMSPTRGGMNTCEKSFSPGARMTD